MNEETRKAIEKSMSWMVKTLKWQEDNARGGIKGAGEPYSDHLRKASELLTELEGMD